MKRFRGAAWTALACWLLLLLMSADAAADALSLQRGWERQRALQSLRAGLADPATDARQIQHRFERFVADPASGFRFLALRDSEGRVVAAAGRYENESPSWVPADLARQWRELRYVASSTQGSLRMRAGLEASKVEYSLGEPTPREWVDPAVARLARLALGGGIAALAGLVALALLWRRSPGGGAARSDAGMEPPPSRTGLEDGQRLSQAGLGLMHVDRTAHLLELNAAAEAFCGWSLEAARGQQLFSVLRLRDQAGRPHDEDIRSALSSAPASFEGWLMGREGPRWVELRVAPLHEMGRRIGGVIVLMDAEPRRHERETLTRAVRMPHVLMDGLGEAVIQVDASGLIRYSNAPLRRWLGYAPEELAGQSFRKLLPVPFVARNELTLDDYGDAPATSQALPRVLACHHGGEQSAVTLKVERLSSREGWVVILRPAQG